ncbi:hypothetical protein DYB38_007590 [Aphanomyces astaci]|uniref:Vacuolar membrane-associated protein Iml1 N-terminal domain-containing protein n=1 Tax=Aphanomyces astaci TaxID=112090 RepID=A0A397EH04_APHAT|nr:hypothetical protein DYB38_007590 [Aphanomyces astaci]
MNRRRWTRPSAKDAAAVSSIAVAATKGMESVKKKSKDRAIVKLHVHGLEFHGGEELVLNVDALKPDLTFPDDDAYVMEIFTPNCTEDSRQHLLMDVPSPDELKAKKPVKGKMQLSLLKDTAAQFNLQLLQDVMVRFIEKHAVEVDFVEVSLKDQFLSRRDLFYLQRNLVGKALYVGKMVRMHGARVQVMELVHENEAVVTGVVTAKTRFVFRSKSSRIFWLVQISPEMWDMHFKPRKVDITCEKCPHGKQATMTCHIQSLPPVLVLHLKRFEVQHATLTKRVDAVDTPVTLDPSTWPLAGIASKPTDRLATTHVPTPLYQLKVDATQVLQGHGAKSGYLLVYVQRDLVLRRSVQASAPHAE